MKARINIITLMVSDLQKAVSFYRDGLGLMTTVVDASLEDHVLFELENGLSLVLFHNSDYKNDNSGLVLSHIATKREEVNAILESAKAAGGIITNPPTQEIWGYYGSFTDLDGHEWEIMWNPHFELN